jgi:hypothetical protein
MIPTEANEPFVAIVVKYFDWILISCDPLNDWISHVYDPTVRDAMRALGQAFAAAIGCGVSS